MLRTHLKIKLIVLIILSLTISTFTSFCISHKNTTNFQVDQQISISSYIFPLFKEYNFLNIYIQLLPIETLSNFYNYRIEDVRYSKKLYLSDDEIAAEIKLINKKNNTKTLWLTYSLKDPLGNTLDFQGKEVTLAGNSQNLIELSIAKDYFSKHSLISGNYDAVFALWDKNPIFEDAKPMSHYKQEKVIRLYSTHEVFDSFDPKRWFSREGTLGRTLLTPENVFINDQALNIKIPKNSYSGGEIRSLKTVHHGSYEINMQLPTAPTSITGFFLYKAPDYYHEIDIEIYNKKTTEILLTTYANGAVQNNTILPLNFDPTSTFNTYRIDYYPHKVSFYVNNQLIEKFTNGFSKDPMYLMVNTWYPNWLEGIQQKNDQYLKIKWIRY